MSELAQLWSDLLESAMALDPSAVRLEILASRDDGLRAANYDSAGGRSADVSSHPERMALNPCKDRTESDLGRLESLMASYVAAVGAIAVRSRSGVRATTWDGAVKDHNLLDQMGAVGVLERIEGEKPAKWVRRAADALRDLERMADQHAGRDPTEDEKHWHDGTNVNDVCAWHLAIHQRHRRPRTPGTNICATCQALVLAGEGARPPAWVIEAEIDRGSRPKAWTAALSRWLDELGIARSA